MNAFWNSLHRLAQGQLFAHGHLTPRTALELAARETPMRVDGGGGGKAERCCVVVWPRLATPH